MGWCDSWFFCPTRKVYQDPAEYGLAPRDLWIDAEPGVRLHAWLFEPAVPMRALVLHFHGNAGNLTAHFPFIAWMPAQGLGVLSFDYRGYGRSTGGPPSRAGIVADGLAAAKAAAVLAAQRRVPMVGFGQSLGGVVAAAVAAREPAIAGVVLDSAFSGYRREAAWIARQSLLMRPVWRLAGRWLISDGHDALHTVAAIAPRPVLIMHSKADRIVDWHQATELYEAAGEPKDLWLTDGAEHCEFWFEQDGQARARMLAFVDCLRSA